MRKLYLEKFINVSLLLLLEHIEIYEKKLTSQVVDGWFYGQNLFLKPII